MATQPTWLQHPQSDKYTPESEIPFTFRCIRWFGHQRWIPKGQDRVLRLLDRCRRGRHFLFEVDFFGQRYRGDLEHFIDWLVFYYGSSATSELSLLKACVEAIRSKKQSPVLFLDIGGNAGHHTLFMAPIVDQVITFEPYPPLQTLIRERLELNHIQNVQLMPFGLADEENVLDYYPGQGSNSGSGTFLPDEIEHDADPVKLQIKKGDSVLEQLAVEKVDIMKVDVEGFEAGVIRGLKNRILRDRPIILMELSEESKRQFGSEEAFRDSFYPGASFVSVIDRAGHNYKLRPFKYARQFDEILIIPQGLEWLSKALSVHEAR
jgi:FkbM family methyltransferase